MSSSTYTLFLIGFSPHWIYTKYGINQTRDLCRRGYGSVVAKKGYRCQLWRHLFYSREHCLTLGLGSVRHKVSSPIPMAGRDVKQGITKCFIYYSALVRELISRHENVTFSRPERFTECSRSLPATGALPESPVPSSRARDANRCECCDEG